MPTPFPAESIPDSDVLFRRVHRNHVSDDGELQPSAFKLEPLSTHWQKYCPTPEEARQKARKPEENGVVQFIAGRVRAIPLTVRHTPVSESSGQAPDRSHTEIIGLGSAETRSKLLDIAEWRLRLVDHHNSGKS